MAIKNWKEKFDCEFIEKDTEDELLRNERIKTFIRQSRQELLEGVRGKLPENRPIIYADKVMRTMTKFKNGKIKTNETELIILWLETTGFNSCLSQVKNIFNELLKYEK